MTVFYIIPKLLSLPATIIRAFYEHIILKCFKVPVENDSYMRMNELFGHVEHDLISGISGNFVFCCLPGLMQVLFALPMMAVSFLQLHVLGVTPIDPQTGTVSVMFIICAVLRIFGIWLLSNVFPLYEDSLNLFEKVGEINGFKKVILYPIATVVRAGAFLERFGLTFWILVAETVLLLWVF